MRIAFAGAGAIGCHYGSKLIQAGFDVLLLARGKHLEALQDKGLKHESDGQVRQVKVEASGDVSQLKACQIVILSCKMTDLSDMLLSLQDNIEPDTLLVTLQNGVEAPDMVAAAFPDNAVAAGTAFIGARLEQPGFVIHSAAGGVRLGMWKHGSGEVHLSALIKAFQQAEIPTREDNDPTAMLWRKLLWNCGFNAITAITRRYARDMAAHAETLQIIRQAMQETMAVAKAIGINLNETDISKHIEITLSMGPVKSSMWQDIEAGRITEVNFINAYVVKKAAELKLPAPANSMLTSLVHAIENQKQGPVA